MRGCGVARGLGGGGGAVGTAEFTPAQLALTGQRESAGSRRRKKVRPQTKVTLTTHNAGEALEGGWWVFSTKWLGQSKELCHHNRSKVDCMAVVLNFPLLYIFGQLSQFNELIYPFCHSSKNIHTQYS